MEAEEVRELVHKFETGGNLTKFDLDILLAHYFTLTRALAAMPTRYHRHLTDFRVTLRQIEAEKAKRKKLRK